MKKSNIILVSLFGIFLIIIFVIQFKIKSTITDIEVFDFRYDAFEKLEIQSGWIVKLHNDSLTKITINNDSIKDLISLTGNTLILKEDKNDSNQNKIISITNPCTKDISVAGNSNLHYYTEVTTDSLLVSFKDDSYVTIDNKYTAKNSDEDSRSTVHFLQFKGTDIARLNIYTNVDTLEGCLQDTSNVYIRAKATIRNLKKSKEARINTW